MAEAVKKSLYSVRTRFLRRPSTYSDPSSTASTSPDVPDSETQLRDRPKHTRKSTSPTLASLAVAQNQNAADTARLSVANDSEKHDQEVLDRPQAATKIASISDVTIGASDPPPSITNLHRPPALLIQAPSTPELKADQKLPNGQAIVTSNNQLESSEQPDPISPNTAPSSRPSSTRPPLTRTSTRGSYVGHSGGMLGLNHTRPSTRDSETNDAFVDAVQTQPRKMPKRKVWVRRPGASATLVPYDEDDLVDDVRDYILRKYANSLGRTFDSPDMTIKIQPRERSSNGGREKTLGPEESVLRVLDAYFPGGQDVTEAFIIDVPQRRTPRVSPRIGSRAHVDHFDDHRPAEDDTGYFPPMPVAGQLTPQGRNIYTTTHAPHSISILETGQVPPLPSPREKRTRPRPHRQQTSSPTILSPAGSANSHAIHTHATPRRVRHDSDDRIKHIPAPPPLPSPSGQEVPAAALTASGHPVGTPPAVSHPAAAAVSPRLPPSSISKKTMRRTIARRDSPIGREVPSLPFSNDIDAQTSVPPINVLIVEDNIINLKVLEMMVGKLKVRWATAMNGRDAVTKWREGGFHLVLMDIQLPIMSGLEATKEIRRLERANGIGVFSTQGEDSEAVNGTRQGMNGHATSGVPKANGVALARRGSKEASEADRLTRGGTFKSPVIIVALTASSLQSDRREALAAGCNDFLTKPVNFTWFSQKVKEWGCMQALIDFDGWRAWKNLTEVAESQKLAAQEQETDEERTKRVKREEKERKKVEMLQRMGKS